MSHKLKSFETKHARNSRAYAIGEQKSNGFHIRRVVWGWTMAKAERRPNEKIVRVIILIDGTQ